MNIVIKKSGSTVPHTHVSWVWLVVFSLWLLSSYCSTLYATETRVSITNHQGYQHLHDNLEALVKTEGKEGVNHHFFVATYPPERDFTYLFWREGRALWILEIGDENPHHWESVIANPRSGTRIDLDRDVVEDPGTSTYLVGKSWVKNIIYDAVLNGDLIVVNSNP